MASLGSENRLVGCLADREAELVSSQGSLDPRGRHFQEVTVGQKLKSWVS